MPSRRIPFSVHISYLFIGLLVAFALVTNSIQFLGTRQLITEEAGQRYKLIRQHAIADLEQTYNSAATGSHLLARQVLMQATTLQQRLETLPLLAAVFKAQPNANAMYVGYETGDFFLLRPWRGDPRLQTLFDAPAGTAWMVQSIQMLHAKRVGAHLFFSAEMKLIERRAKPDYQYDPRTRDWYQQAKLTDGLFVQPAYIFSSTGEAGNTFAYRASNGLAVAGVDVTLRTVSELLHKNKITPNTIIAFAQASIANTPNVIWLRN